MEFFTHKLKMFISFLKNYLHDDALNIFVVTIIIRVILLPFSIIQAKFMASSKRVQDEIEKIKQRYEGNSKKINEETVKVYSKGGLNPLSFFFSFFVQIAVTVMFFKILNSGHLFDMESEFLGWKLGEADKTYLFPLLNTLLFLISTRKSLLNFSEKSEENISKLFFVFFLFFISLKFVVATHIYSISNTFFSILQEYLFSKFLISESVHDLQ